MTRPAHSADTYTSVHEPHVRAKVLPFRPPRGPLRAPFRARAAGTPSPEPTPAPQIPVAEAQAMVEQAINVGVSFGILLRDLFERRATEPKKPALDREALAARLAPVNGVLGAVVSSNVLAVVTERSSLEIADAVFDALDELACAVGLELTLKANPEGRPLERVADGDVVYRRGGP